MNNIIRRRTASIWVLSLLLFGMSACKQYFVSDSLAGFDTGGDIAIMRADIVKPGSVSGDRFVNILSGEVLDLDAASTQPENIDMAVLYGVSTGLNFVTPSDIARLNGWSTGQTMNNEWLTKNKATLIKLDASTESAALFDSIRTAAQLKAAYQQTLHDRPDTLDSRMYGPGPSLRELQQGDVVFFKSEARDFYAVIKITEANVASAGSAGLDIKLDNSTAKQVPPADTSNRMTVYDVSLTRPGYDDGDRCLDFSSGMVSGYTQAAQEKVDLLLFNEAGSGFNLIVPSDTGRLARFSMGTAINGNWLVKNKGSLLKLNASDAADSLFLYTVNNERIRESYAHAVETIKEAPGYNPEVNGPGGFVSQIAEGDVILFKSESRKIYGMARVETMSSGETGGIELSVKVDNSSMVNVPPPPKRELVMSARRGYSQDALFIDLAAGEYYDEDPAKELAESIDLVFVTGGNTNLNLFPPTSTRGLKAFSAAWTTRMESWPTRNDGLLINVGSAEAYQALYDGLKEGDAAAIKNAYEEASTHFKPTDRLTNIATGDVILFRSISRDAYVAMLVVDAADEGSLHVRYKTSE